MAVSGAPLAALPVGSRIYLDTNIWIYALEGFAPFADRLAALFARVDQGELIAITSELTLAEALVKPFSSNQPALQEVYLDALQSSHRTTRLDQTRRSGDHRSRARYR